MNRGRETIRRSLLGVCCLGGLIWSSMALGAAPSAEQVDERVQAVRTEVQEAIQQAEALSESENYAEALKLLFDALYTEQQTLLMLAAYSEKALNRDLDELFPITAGKAITQLERRVIHEDQSPLMRWFRTPDIPLREKLTTLASLRAMATERGQTGGDTPFQEQYSGTLVQLMRSPLLDRGEKRDILRELRFAIQTEYTSEEQQDRVREEIRYLRHEAKKALQDCQYVEAFVLISEASQRSLKMRLFEISMEEYDSLTELKIHIEKTFVGDDDSSLIQAFKNRDISTRKRQFMLYDLRNGFFEAGTGTITLNGVTYDGVLVDVLLHPDVDWLIKDRILNEIDWKFLEPEPDWVPEYLLGTDRER